MVSCVRENVRRWIVSNYPFSSESAATFVNKYPTIAAELVHLLPQETRELLLSRRSVGLSALEAHPELFTKEQISRFVSRYRIKPANLTLPVRRILGMYPFDGSLNLTDVRKLLDVDVTPLFFISGGFSLGCAHLPILLASADDIKNNTQWHSQLLAMCNLSKSTAPTINSIVDVLPCVPKHLHTKLGKILGKWVRHMPYFSRVRRISLDDIGYVGRLSLRGYAAFVKAALCANAIGADNHSVRAILSHQMRGLQLPKSLLNKLIARYPAVLAHLYHTHYVQLSRSQLYMTKKTVVASALENLR